MTRLGKRRRAKRDGVSSDAKYHRKSTSPPEHHEVRPINEKERQEWQGFCEIESDPAFFNVMLKEFGVKGVKIQEVFGLDEELLAMLPKPVYGLVFLFRYRDIEEERQEAACPEEIWFANQISNNSCATVALLNIVNNIPDIELGEHLQSFKNFTHTFTPALRGTEIANFRFVKSIHNSFARKMDMLISDFAMESCFNSRRSAKARASDGDDTSALHFTAFVPINGDVWKLDGLDRQPENLGEITNNDWLTMAVPILSAKMAEYEEGQTDFALMSLVKDPLPQYQLELADNMNCIDLVNKRLERQTSETKTSIEADGLRSITNSSSLALYGVSEADIRKSVISPEFEERLRLASSASQFNQLKEDLEKTQSSLRSAIIDEMQACSTDKEKASHRRHDYGPLIETWLEMLIDNGELRSLIEQVG